METHDLVFEQILKVLKDIETNTFEKQQLPETTVFEKKLDQLIKLQEMQVKLLELLTHDRCTCKKSRVKKEKKEKKEKKTKKEKS